MAIELTWSLLANVVVALLAFGGIAFVCYHAAMVLHLLFMDHSTGWPHIIIDVSLIFLGAMFGFLIMWVIF